MIVYAIPKIEPWTFYVLHEDGREQAVRVTRENRNEKMYEIIKPLPPPGTGDDVKGYLGFVPVGRAVRGTANADIVMAIDDNGYDSRPVEKGPNHFELVAIRKRRPVNRKATDLYWAICKPGTTHEILGTVILMHDSDWDEENIKW